MAFVPVADTAEVQLFQMYFGQKIENTLYFKLTGGFGAGELVDLWNNLLVWWTTSLAASLSQDLSLRGSKLTDLSTQTGISLEFNAPTPNPTGAILSPGLPGNVALCVSLKTANRGRSFRGRNFVPGLSENDVSGNTVATDKVSAIQASYNGLRSIAFDNPWEHVVVSRVSGGVPRVTGVATAVTSAVIIDPFVDSQRRRLTGRGQ